MTIAVNRYLIRLRSLIPNRHQNNVATAAVGHALQDLNRLPLPNFFQALFKPIGSLVFGFFERFFRKLAGLNRFRRVSETPFNLVYEARP